MMIAPLGYSSWRMPTIITQCLMLSSPLVLFGGVLFLLYQTLIEQSHAVWLGMGSLSYSGLITGCRENWMRGFPDYFLLSLTNCSQLLISWALVITSSLFICHYLWKPIMRIPSCKPCYMMFVWMVMRRTIGYALLVQVFSSQVSCINSILNT